jgi:hypothetical protein
MIQHHHGLAAGFEHAMYFAYGCPDVRRVMQYAVRINQVKRRVWKIQVLGIADQKAPGQTGQRESSARQLNGSIRKIHTSVISAGLSELCAIRSQAAPNFQNLPTAGRGKIGGCGNMPLFFITVPFDPLEKFAAVRLSIGEFAAARMFLPKSAHASLQFIVGG